MERMAEYEYVKTGRVDEQWLTANGFTFDKIRSDKECDAYTYRFPVYKYEGTVVLDGEITIWPDENNMIRINCYEHATRNIFARFYYWEYGTDDTYMEVINRKFERKLEEFGVQIIPPVGTDNEKNIKEN